MKCPESNCREDLIEKIDEKLSKKSLLPFIGIAVLVAGALIGTWAIARGVPALTEQSAIRETRLTRLEERYAAIMVSQGEIKTSVDELKRERKEDMNRILSELRSINRTSHDAYPPYNDFR